MIPLQTAVRVAPSVCRHFAQLRGVTTASTIVSVPASVKISPAVCDIYILFVYIGIHDVYMLWEIWNRMCFVVYKIHCMLPSNI